MSSKPWDGLRKSVEPVKPPIGPGTWSTTDSGIPIPIVVTDVKRGGANIYIPRRDSGMAPLFICTELRQLAEFCTELADQLSEGGK